MLGGGEVLRGLGLRHYIGVFDARMERIYRFIGSAPEVLGQDGTGRNRISAGLWGLTDADRSRVARRARLCPRPPPVRAWPPDAAFAGTFSARQIESHHGRHRAHIFR